MEENRWSFFNRWRLRNAFGIKTGVFFLFVAVCNTPVLILAYCSDSETLTSVSLIILWPESDVFDQSRALGGVKGWPPEPPFQGWALTREVANLPLVPLYHSIIVSGRSTGAMGPWSAEARLSDLPHTCSTHVHAVWAFLPAAPVAPGFSLTGGPPVRPSFLE